MIPLPDFEADGFTFSQLELYDIGIGGIDSAYHRKNLTTLFLGTEEMTAKVSGHYRKQLLSGPLSAEVSNMGFNMNVFMNSTIIDQHYEVPNGISLSACEFESIKVKVSLNLGLNHPLVDLALENEIKAIFCNSLGSLLAGNITAAMENKLDPFLVQVMGNEADPVPASYENPDLVDWSQHIFGPLHSLLAVLGVSDLMQCFLNRHPEVVMPYAASLVDAAIDLATNGTGQIFVELNTSSSVDRQVSVLHLGDNVTMELQSVLIGGLDTLSNLQVLAAENSSSQTSLVTTLVLDRLDVNFSSITFVNGRGDDADDINLYHYNETTLWAVSLRNLSLSFELEAAVNGTFLRSSYMDQLLTSPSCLLESLRNMSISSMQFDVDVQDVTMYQVHGEASSLEADTVALMNNMYELLTNGFQAFLTDIIAGATQGGVRRALNILLQREITSKREQYGTCPIHVSHQGKTDNVVWAQSSVIEALNALINPTVANKLMNCLTNDSGTSGPLLLPLRNSTTTSKGFEVQVGGLNSWYSMNLLEPQPQVSKYTLRSSLGVGICENNQIPCTSPLTVVFGRELVLSGNDEVGGSYVEVLVGNLSLTSSSTVLMNLDNLYDLMLQQMQVNGCVMSTFSSVDINSLFIDVDELVLVFAYQDGLNNTHDISDIAHTYLPIISERLLPAINDYINTQLSIAPETCDDGGVTPSSGGSGASATAPAYAGWKLQLGVIVAASVLALAAFIFHHRYLDYRKEIEKQGGEVHDSASLNDEEHFFSSAIVCDRRIPLWFRVLFPMSIVATFGLFVYSNLSEDPVSVHAYVFVEGVPLPPVTVFSFSLAGTVQDMWDAKVYALSSLIAFFSGGWPYVKLTVMIVSMLFPRKALPVAWRDGSLKFVDAYGKWSLIDFFVMCMFLCAFYFDLRLSRNNANDNNADAGIEVILRVVPTFGFYSFLLATLISLGQGHIALAIHRFDAFEHSQTPLHHFKERKNVRDHKFAVALTSRLRSLLYEVHERKATGSGRANSESGGQSDNHNGICLHEDTTALLLQDDEVAVSVTSLGTFMLVIAYITAFIFICVGIYVHSFNFKFIGLTGLLLGDNAEISYSVLSISQNMVTDSGLTNDLSMRWMQSCFLTTCVAMPLLAIAIILFMWIGPRLTINMQKSFFLLAEITNAWCALDVLCASVIACILEIRQFAAFMVGDKCDGLNVVLSEYMDTQLHGEDVCFDVMTTLTPQVSLLFLAMVIIFVANNLSLWLFERCLSERLAHDSRADHDWKFLQGEASSPIHASALKNTAARVTDLREPLLRRTDGDQWGPRRDMTSEDKNEGLAATPSTSYQRCCKCIRLCANEIAWKLLAILWKWGAVEIASSERMIDMSADD